MLTLTAATSAAVMLAVLALSVAATAKGIRGLRRNESSSGADPR